MGKNKNNIILALYRRLLFMILFTKALVPFSNSQNNDFFHGSSQFSFYYNSLNANPQQLPPYYFLWSGNQQAGIKDLPFEINWNLSSASPYGRLIPNSFAVNFDKENFRKNLRHRAEKEIKAESFLQWQKQTKINEIRKNKEAITAFFNDAAVKNQIKLIADHDSLVSLLEKPNQNLTQISQDSLKALIAISENNINNKDAILELQKKKEELDHMDISLSGKDTLKDVPLYDYSSLNDPGHLTRELESRGKLSKAEKAGMWIEQLSAGRFSPQWHDFILKGISCDGIEIAASPRNFYAGITAGSLYPWQMLGRPLTNQPFERNMIAGKVGFGQENSSHIRIHLLQFRDRVSSSLSLYPPSPKANYLAGLSGQWHTFNKRLRLKFQLTGSQTNNTMLDNADPLVQTGQLTVPAPDNPSKWLGNIINQKQNSLIFSTDKAFTGEARVQPFSSGPILFTEIKYAGTYYQSFGAPFLPTDYRVIKSGVEQSLLKNRIYLEGSFANYRDNLSDLKKFTTSWNNVQAGLRIIPTRSLSVFLSYRNIYQYSPVMYRYHLLILHANRLYQRNFWKSVSGINYSAQFPGSGNMTNSLMGSHNIVSPRGHSLFSSLTGFFSASGPMLAFQITPKILLFRKWTQGVGYNMYASSNFYSQQGFHYESALKLSDKFNFSLRMEYKTMQNNAPENYNYQQGGIWYMTSGLTAYW